MYVFRLTCSKQSFFKPNGPKAGGSVTLLELLVQSRQLVLHLPDIVLRQGLLPTSAFVRRLADQPRWFRQGEARNGWKGVILTGIKLVECADDITCRVYNVHAM